MMNGLKKFVPRGLKHGVKMRWLRSVLPQLTPMIEDQITGGAEAVYQSHRRDVVPNLYDPWRGRNPQGTYFLHAADLVSPPHNGGLPVPPPDLRQGYRVGSEDGYIEDGAITARHIRQILDENGVPFAEGSVVLDWGCASGRVLRHFRVEAERAEAERGEFWGTDQDEHCMMWARENLCPPFRFVTCNAYPHLPFEDNTFTHLYGISIFTHVVYLVDAWLMELRRILRPGGHALLTVHTEEALDEMERGYWPPWLDRATDLDAIRAHDLSVITQGSWENTYPFYRLEWLRKDWSRFMDIVDLRPSFVPYVQTAVLMRKPLR